jgi:hypothetical protein
MSRGPKGEKRNSPTETVESDISIWANGDISIWRLQAVLLISRYGILRRGALQYGAAHAVPVCRRSVTVAACPVER